MKLKGDQTTARAMAQATNGLAESLKQLAGGDLTVQISEPFDADFEGLRQDFNSTVAKLSQTLAEVAGSAINIDGGSNEIANSANDLAKRTEQQAAALEQTAAALDEITANVASASKRAEEAREVAARKRIPVRRHQAKSSAKRSRPWRTHSGIQGSR